MLTDDEEIIVYHGKTMLSQRDEPTKNHDSAYAEDRPVKI